MQHQLETGEGDHRPAQALSRKRATNWFDQTLVTRLNDRKKELVMHRLHQEDLTEHLLSKPKNIWHHICLPIIAENKEIVYSIKKPAHPVSVIQVTATRQLYNTTASCAAPAMILYSREEGQLLYPLYGGKEEVETIKVELGSYAFAAQYQQNPLPLSSETRVAEAL